MIFFTFVHVQGYVAVSGVAKVDGPPLAALLWGRHYELRCCTV